MRKVLGYMMSLAVVLVALSCERRPLIELSDSRYRVEFEFNTQIMHDTVKELPQIMNVLFFHSNAKNYETSSFVENYGGEVYVTPSTYDILTYNFNTESTIIKNNRDYQAIEATTNEVSDYLLTKLQYAMQTRTDIRENNFKTKGETQDRVMNEPDHLFVALKEQTRLVPFEDEQTIKLYAESIVKRWKVQVNYVEGVEYLSEASMVISGAVPKVNLVTKELGAEKVSLLTELKISKEDGILYGEFNTFGMHPLDEKDPQLLSLVLVDKQGKQYHCHYKITNEILKVNEQKLQVVDNIKIEAPQQSGGGFLPSVNEWQEIITDIEI